MVLEVTGGVLFIQRRKVKAHREALGDRLERLEPQKAARFGLTNKHHGEGRSRVLQPKVVAKRISCTMTALSRWAASMQMSGVLPW